MHIVDFGNSKLHSFTFNPHSPISDWVSHVQHLNFFKISMEKVLAFD